MGMPTPDSKSSAAPPVEPSTAPPIDAAGTAQAARPREIGGPSGPEPTRFGDWEKNGRCIDF
jgi:hypothetical protein